MAIYSVQARKVILLSGISKAMRMGMVSSFKQGKMLHVRSMIMVIYDVGVKLNGIHRENDRKRINMKYNYCISRNKIIIYNKIFDLQKFII